MEPNESNERKEPARSTEAVRYVPPEERVEKRTLNRRLLVPVIAVLVAFGLGFVPMWLKAMENAKQRDTAERQMRLLRLEALIAGAAVDARRGEYETARQGASQFFTLLLQELNLEKASALTVEQKEGLKELLAQRDDLITLLARSDPASAERLANGYLKYRQSTGAAVGAAEPALPASKS